MDVVFRVAGGDAGVIDGPGVEPGDLLAYRHRRRTGADFRGHRGFRQGAVEAMPRAPGRNGFGESSVVNVFELI